VPQQGDSEAPSEGKKLRQIEEGNGRLRNVADDLTLDTEILQNLNRGKL
jgi:hypothetical protein